MVAQTQAQVSFTGNGNLGQIIEKINDNVKKFGTNTGETTKNLIKLNKEAKTSDGIFKTLSENVKTTADGFLGLGRNTKDTFNFFTKAGKSTLDLNENLTSVNKGLTGLGLRFVGLRKQTTQLNTVLEGPAAHLAEIADASSNTERAFIILSKVAKPLRASLTFLSEQAQRLSQFFLRLETVVINLVRKGINLAAKAIEFFANKFSELSRTVAKFGVIGKVVGAQFASIGTSLGQATMGAKAFNESLDPTKLERVDKTGQSLSDTLGRVSKGLESAAAGVILADTLGKVIRRFSNARQTVEDVGFAATETFSTTNEVIDRSGAKVLLFNNQLTATQTIAGTLGNVFQNNLLRAIGSVAEKVNVFIAAFSGFKIVTEGIADAAIQMSGLNDAFIQAQSLGIDTTAAEIAFQFGLVGEKLLFSSEAAKEFGRTAITAFAQTEDAASFVTTLSSGAALQFEGLQEGLQSVTAFSTELANSLDNTVTSGEAAFALYNTLSAGVGIAADGTQDLTAQQNFLEAALKLSSGTGANAAETLSLLATTTKVYGLSANEAATTAAKLNQVVEQGQITFPQLTNQLGRTLATAEATNVSLDETLASVSALTKVQGEDALVGFTSLLSSIAGQGAQAQKEIQELGIQFDLQTIKAKGLNESLRDLVVATGGNAEVLKRIIPDTLAFQTALTLVNAVGQDVDTTLQNIGTTGTDSLEAVFAASQQSTIKQFTGIMNGFNEVLVDFGQRVQPALQPGIDALRNLLNIFQNLPEPVKNAIGLLVIAQTTINNIGGGLLGLGATIAKLILSIVAFRLVNKALTGQLKAELDVIKQLVAVEGDYGGALTRLVGLNENFSSATIQTTKAINNTKKALKGLEEQGFELPGDSLEDFKTVLNQVQMRIKDVNRSPLRFTDPENTKAQLTALKELQKDLTNVINTTEVARKLTLKETRTNIDNALKEVNVTAQQRINRFEELILGLVNPNLVGSRSDAFKREISDLFEDTLLSAQMTTEEKIGRISDTFNELRRESPATVKSFLTEIESEIFSGFGRIEGQAEKLRMTVKNVSGGLFANSPQAVKTAFNDAVKELSDGFLNIENTLEERKRPLNEVFRRTISALPEELDELKPQLVIETNKLLDASQGTIEERIVSFNKSFARLAKGLPDELRQQAGEVKVATQELTRALESPLSGRDNFGVAFARAAVNLRNGVKTIEEVTPVVEQKIGEVNTEIKKIAGPETQRKIKSNLDKVGNSVEKFATKAKKDISSIDRGGGRTFGAFNDSLDGLSGVLAGFSPQLSSVLDTVSNFLSSSRELTGGLGELGNVTKTYSGNLKDVAASTGNATKSQGLLAATNRLLGKNMFGASQSANAFAIASAKAGASTGLLSKVTGIATAGMAGLTTAFTTATAAAGSLIATLTPFVAPLAAIGAAGFFLFKALQEIIPALGKATDASKKFAAQSDKTNKSISESLNVFRKYKETSEGFGRDAEGNALSLQKMKEGFEEVNEAAENQRESATVLQGFRGAIVNLVEFILFIPQQIQATLVKVTRAILEFGANILQKILPFGEVLNKTLLGPVVKTIGRIGDFLEERLTGTNDRIRKFFNDVRDDAQAFIAREARAAVLETQELTTELLIETNKIKNAQARGDAAAERSKAIIAAAEEANRVLSANELKTVIQEENALSRLSIELIKEQISAREEELEKAKDPVVRANLENQIAALQKQTTELEKRNKLQEEFLRNQQAIGQNIQANNAAASQQAVNEQLQNTVDELGNVGANSEKAQMIFKNILGVVKQVNDETGQTQFIRPETVNQASQAGRRAELAIQSTVAKVSSQIANLNDISSNLTQDDVAQGIFQVFDAVDKAVSEDPRFAEQGASIINSILNEGAQAAGAEGNIANILSPAQLQEVVERQTAIIETEFAQRTKAQERSIKRVEILRELGEVNAVEAAQVTSKAQESIDAERIMSIEKRIEAARNLGLEGSRVEKSLIKELEEFRIQSDLNRLNERRKILDEELNLLRAQKDNEIQLLKNETQERSNTIELAQRANQQEQKALSARQNLVQSLGQFEETILQNRLKLTGDVEEQAQIQLELAKQRISISEQENEFERQNILLQQQLNSLALERESIQLRIQAAEAEAELAANNARLAKAEELGLTKEEEEAIMLQNQALNMQGQLLADSQAQLEGFAEKQEIINTQELEALDLRQRAQKEAANVDLEIAERNKVLAVFDKQIQQARTQARIVELTNEERKVGLQDTTRLLDAQNNILNEQKNLLESTANVLQSNFQIAINAERNSFRRRRLEEQAAKSRLRTIQAQQKIEEAIFKINEQQRDLALEIRQIELAANREKLAAEVAVAEAEAARAAADPTKTAEEIEAARLGVRAAEAQLRANESQQVLLSQERALNAQQSGLRELQFRQQQENEVFQARANVAQTTLSRADDRAIGQEALARASAQEEQLNQLVKSFNDGISEITAPTIRTPETSAVMVEMPSIEFPKVDGNINITVKVEGDSEVVNRIDESSLNAKITKGSYEALNDLFDYAKRRR